MPAHGVKKLSHEDILSYEQFHIIATAAVAIGVEKIRITGGEPLVRKGIIDFLADLKRIPGLKRLVITTNGILLEEMAEGLRDAGVESLNVSLDSMYPDVFSTITRGGDLQRALRGIDAAIKAGFPYMKINMVVMRGVNDAEVEQFAAMTLDAPFKVRFIEFMPTLKNKSQSSLTVPGEELLKRLSRKYQLERVEKELLDGPSVDYKIQGAAGTIGFINPMSNHFCAECNRIRVTAKGFAKSCLFNEDTVDLRHFLHAGDDDSLKEALCSVVNNKMKHFATLKNLTSHRSFTMSQIGG
jgi:cyclic pyranopterin phosphate synthase